MNSLQGWVRTTWSEAGLIMRASTFSRSCLLRNWNTRGKHRSQLSRQQPKTPSLTPNLSFPCVTNPAQKQAHSASEQFLRALFPRVRWAVGLLHPRCRALYFPLLFFLGIPAGGKRALQPTVTSVHTTPLASVLFLQALALWCQL